MRKRKYPDSGHGSRSRKSKRRYKLEKDLRSLPTKNVMESRKRRMSSMETKDLHNPDSISLERSKGCVTPSDKTPRSCESPLRVTDVRSPVKSTILRKNIHDKWKLSHSIQSVMGSAEKKFVSKNLDAVSVADNQVSALAGGGDFLKMKRAEWTGGNKSHTSSHDVKKTYRKKKKAISRKVKDRSFISKVTQETRALGNKTFSVNSSLIDTADVALPSKNNTEASISGNLILSTNRGSSSKKADDDIAQMSGMVCKDGSNSIIFEETSLKHHRKKRMRKKKSVGSNFVASMSGISKMVPALKDSNEASPGSKQASLAEKETDVMTNSFAYSKTVMIFPRINSAPRVARKRCRRKKRKPDSYQCFDTIKNNVRPNIDTKDGDSDKCANRSPVRVVVEEVGSPNLPMKQHIWLDSCNEECKNFSFQINSSKNHSREAFKLGIQDGPESVDLAVDEKNALDCKYKHSRASISQEKEMASSSMSHVLKDVVSSDVTNNQDKSSSLAVLSTTETLLSCSRKKLLVLDLNGLLADINPDYRIAKAHKAHKIGGNLVVKRPFCDDFLKFCFERFHVGVWSSRKRKNVDKVIDYLMGNLKHNLLFCWDQSKCTDTGRTTIENMHKPLVLKELKKLWNKEECGLPWEKGDYSPSNTLLVDDSPYKAICNPPHTALFPYPYSCTNENDNSLGPRGDVRVYLEGLAMVDDVQHYVREHPFGQKAIAENNPSWKFYLRIIDQFQKSSSLTY